jgi:CBS domain-containing protein
VEKTGPQKGKFNIKLNGLCPIIDAARLSALETGVYDTSTAARLMELRDRHGTMSEFSGELEQAFEFLLSMRLRRQYQQITEGKEPDNFIDPNELGALDRKLLKEAFKLILSAQNAAREKYGSLMVL